MSGVDLTPGAIFAEQFRVVRPLGRGGMGAVYVVEQLGTGRERALKLMHPTLVSDERSRERFEREARIGSRIESDHVVEVIASGIEPTSGTPWICMELLRGESLDERMERAGAMKPSEALEVLRQLGHALGAAHRVGIVHRDLKPENVFLAAPRREGVPFTLKVLDFGIATLAQDLTGPKTTQGVGSPMWMAPEQTDAGKVTQAADVWSLGLLAFHLLTGRLYWKTPQTPGSTLTALLVEIMVEPLVAASVRAAELGVSAGIPAGFDAVFERCVVRDPKLRYQEAASAVDALTSVLTGATAPSLPSRPPITAPVAFDETMASIPPSMTGAGARTGPMAAPPATQAPTVIEPRRRSGFGSGILVGLGLAALTGVAACAGVVWVIAAGVGEIVAEAPGLEVRQDGDRVVIGREGIATSDGTRVSLGEDGLRVDLPDGGTLVLAALGSEAGGEGAGATAPDEPVPDEPVPDEPVPDEPAPAVQEGEAGSEPEPERAAPRRPRAPRLSREEQRFVVAVVRRCAEGNPHTPGVRLDITMPLGNFGIPQTVRIRGGEEDRSLRACIVTRGTEFRFDPAQADPEVHIVTVVP